MLFTMASSFSETIIILNSVPLMYAIQELICRAAILHTIVGVGLAPGLLQFGAGS